MRSAGLTFRNDIVSGPRPADPARGPRRQPDRAAPLRPRAHSWTGRTYRNQEALNMSPTNRTIVGSVRRRLRGWHVVAIIVALPFLWRSRSSRTSSRAMMARGCGPNEGAASRDEASKLPRIRWPGVSSRTTRNSPTAASRCASSRRAWKHRASPGPRAALTAVEKQFAGAPTRPATESSMRSAPLH